MKCSKSSLAVLLSKVSVFEKANILLEQYPTDSETAASLLWTAFQLGDIEDKIIADLGCGTGILGLGCLVLGAKRVYMVDQDKQALQIARKNLEFIEKELGTKFDVVFLNKDISDFREKVNVVVENPPFGVKDKHADVIFLKQAFSISKLVYSLHKTSTKKFLVDYAKRNGFNTTHGFRFNFQLKQTAKFHKKKIQLIDVTGFRFEKTF